MIHHYSCALITGASSGLGEEFAKQLAGRVDKLVLVARRTDRLDAIANVLREANPHVAVMVHAADLSKHAERESLVNQLRGNGFMPEILINNAGLGDYGDFTTADWGVLDAMLKVNIEALTHLSHLIAPEMAKKGMGAILNVSSLASTLPIPDFAVYAATKAYVSSFSEALRIELMEDGVQVMSLCPGPVKTEFGETARREGKKSGMPPAHKSFYVPKEQVVAEGLEGLFGGKARVFPGIQVAAAGFLIGAIPLILLRQILKKRPRR
ncbi:SDR family NAD(P)-dependent oxidoreductase [Luteolibacter sp. AS25]|uniref:SDR family NAD(P)-dependent oxidoreductase n=1 Tax=Luteolibacter sp. AS25 TaxID=3135776 RepID=UPI00398A69F5